jgi:flagellar biosynthesis chaperone FliJ
MERATHISDLETEIVYKDSALNTLEQQVQQLTRYEADIVRQHDELVERAGYISNLETEIARKNAALTTLEQHVQQLEQELIAARTPRLPWKQWNPRR